MPILQFLAGLLSGKSGETIGNTVSTAAQIAAVIAAIAPIGLWLATNKDEVFITLTYGELAFWAGLIGAQVLLVVRLVHRAPPP